MEEKWVCEKCGNENTTNFCINCGTPKPQGTKLEEGVATKTTKFICKNCHSPLRVDTETGLLKCDNCDSTFTYEELGMVHEEIQGIKFSPNSDEWKERYKIQPDNEYDTYKCPQCHATVEVAKNDTWMQCPYCDANLNTAEKIEGRILPDYVIPYKISQSKVIELIKQKLSKYFFLNKIFKANLDKGEVRPLFLPLWTFSGNINADIQYDEQYSTGSGKRRRTHHYRYNSKISTEMKTASVDADKDFDNSISEAVSDYDISTAVKYSSKAVMGIKAKQFSDLPTTCWDYIKGGIKDAVAYTARTVCNLGKDINNKLIFHKHGDVDASIASNVKIKSLKLKYGLVPMYHTHYVNHEIYVNGQTGTIAHTALPINKLRVILCVIGILIINFFAFTIDIRIEDSDWVFPLSFVLWLLFIYHLGKCLKSALNAKTRQRWFGNTKIYDFDNGYQDVSLDIQTIQIDNSGNRFANLIGDQINLGKLAKENGLPLNKMFDKQLGL